LIQLGSVLRNLHYKKPINQIQLVDGFEKSYRIEKKRQNRMKQQLKLESNGKLETKN
jgi:hypothetical protein